MRVSALIISFFVFSSSLIAQEINTFSSFLKNFNKTELPFCFEYSYEEQVAYGAIYELDSLVEKDGDSIYVEYTEVMVENDYERPDTNWLESPDAAKYLIPEGDFIYKFSEDLKDTLFSESMDEYLESSFCALGLLSESNLYYLVSYERIFDYRDYEGSEKFLATISKTGEFISRIQVSSFKFLGTGTGMSGERVPWFGQDRGCVDEELIIAKDPEQSSASYWEINEKGTIIKLK